MNIIHSLKKNTDCTYIYRAYSEPNTLRYKFSMPVSYRDNGMWEAHAWNSVKLLWPEAPLTAFQDAMVFIISELGKIEPRFEKLIGTFERQRLYLYERLFSRFHLSPVGGEILCFNGVVQEAMIVEFNPKSDEEISRFYRPNCL